MDASQSALDSLRTVEFRETLKGYHRDDVDEYLEKAAVEAEGLQEQLRQSGERLRQAAERISQLETAARAAAGAAAARAESSVADDTLQRTLLLAQKFVDETKADSEAQAARIVAEAECQGPPMTEQAQAQASQIAAESEQRLREEIDRLEDSRTRLTHEVETMSRHLEGERSPTAHRARATSCGGWTRTCSPSPQQEAGRRPSASDGPGAGAPPRHRRPRHVVQGGNRPAAGSTQVAPAPRSSGTGPPVK